MWDSFKTALLSAKKKKTLLTYPLWRKKRTHYRKADFIGKGSFRAFRGDLHRAVINNTEATIYLAGGEVRPFRAGAAKGKKKRRKFSLGGILETKKVVIRKGGWWRTEGENFVFGLKKCHFHKKGEVPPPLMLEGGRDTQSSF